MKLIILFLLFPFCLLANSPLSVPDDLAPWKGWVLKGYEESLCPVAYNNADPHFCVWPTSLSLSLDETQGQFEQRVVIYVEGAVSLPGDNTVFPNDIKVNGKPFPVISVDNSPCLFLSPGEYNVTGQFTWEAMPDSIPIPSGIGTLTLKVKGTAAEQPDRDPSGRVWLRRQSIGNASQKEIDSLSLKVFRLIDDTIPQTDLTLIRLFVSGKSREANIGPIFQSNAEPMSVQSPLPYQLTDNGMLRLQVKPGQWDIYVKSRFLKQQDTFSFVPKPLPWPQQEIWSFEPHNDLRLVDLKGTVALDPKQTDLPREWWNHPAYLMNDKSGFMLVEKRRGQVQNRGENLKMNRQLWLDFTGKGYTVVDNLIGSIEQHWRLSQVQPYELGRVTIDGQDRLITHIEPEGPSGVEIRQGQLNLTSVSRVEKRLFQLPALSWDVDVKNLSATLYLPPGWLLVETWGAESSQAWIQKWTLLDLFLVLVIAASVLKLLGVRYGLIAFITLVLSYHEHGAPIWLWLNLIAAFALFKVLHLGGRAEQWMGVYFKASFVVLAVMALPFMVDQIRNAMYPQLSVRSDAHATPMPQMLGGEVKRAMVQENVGMALGSVATAPVRQAKSLAKPKAFELDQSSMDEYDPSDKVQTGPGVPRWTWNAYDLIWSGPVLQAQVFKLWVLPKSVVSFLKLLQVVLMVWLAYGLARPFASRISKSTMPSTAILSGWSIILLGSLLLMGSLMPQPALADFPNDSLLTEYRNRLLEPPSCLPNCADINRMQVQVTPSQLTIRMSLQMAANVAIPLPSQLGKWMPRTVMVDNVVAKQLQVDGNQQLWLQTTEGVHELVMEGPIAAQDRFELSIPLAPKQISLTEDGWQVVGVFDHKLQGNSLTFTRTDSLSSEDTKVQTAGLGPSHIPSFVSLQRDFRLGIDWEITTTLRRLAPTQGPIALRFPLQVGETVISDNVEIKEGKAVIQLADNQNELQFVSRLKMSPMISLVALQDPSVKEIWQIDPMTRWHCTFDGIPMVHQKSPQQRWLPTWQPWPGEKLSIHVVRPVAQAGNTLTIDDSQLVSVPGKEAASHELSFTVRTSQGTNYTLAIPEDAQIQDLRVNGVSQPITLKQGILTIPLDPGVQKVGIRWQLLRGLTTLYRTPSIDLRQQNSNISLQVEMSKKHRWILLLGGPAVGPAVLFWGVLFAILILAIALGRSGYTPLRSWEWGILALGITLATPLAGIVIVGWFMALQKRKTLKPSPVIQSGLIILTVFFVVSLFTSISQGLLDTPSMQIKQPLLDLFFPTSGSSGDYLLRWYQDVGSDALPTAWILSVPLIAYRALMLVWALWLAFSLVKWMRWGWDCFSTKGYWNAEG